MTGTHSNEAHRLRDTKRLRLIMVGLGLSTLLCSCQENTTEEGVYSWIVHQQRATGLVANQEGEDFCALYPNALAAICFIHKGEIERAEKIFLFYQQRYEAEFAEDSPKGFRQFWNSAKGDVYADSDRWIGDNAWLLIALNYYRRSTDRNTFDQMREGIARWLISLQDADGGIRSGFNKNGPMTHKSTEGNLDCYAALTGYSQERARILEWLSSRMWVASDERFRMGSTVDESALDCSAWAVAALGVGHTNTLRYTERRFGRTDTSAANGAQIEGFADFVERKRIWLEGTGEMIVAYRVAGRHDVAERYLRSLEQAMVPSKQFAGAVGLPCSTSDPAWEGADHKIFVPSQAWYLFGKWKFNPMASE